MRFAPTPVNDFIYRYDELPEADFRPRKNPKDKPLVIIASKPMPKETFDNYRYRDVELARRHFIDEEEVIPPDKIVGSFGIIDDNGHEIKLNWVVGGTRTDGKHGYVGDVAYHNNHTISLLETMFKGW